MKYIILTCRSMLAALLLAVAPLVTLAATDAPSLEPQELISQVANKILSDLDEHRARYREQPDKIRELVERNLLPYFDQQYAARLVLSKYWRTASAEQKKRFIDAFYTVLLNNYGESLVDFTPDRLKILKFREDSNPRQAIVRTQIRRDDGSNVQVNYHLHNTAAGWKAYDVNIEGISYIISFKRDLGAEIEKDGLEAMIKRLESRAAVKQPPAKGTTT